MVPALIFADDTAARRSETSRAAMRIALRTDGTPREWHRRLAVRLAREGYTLLIERSPPRRPLPRSLALALWAERFLYGTTSQLFDPAAAPMREEHEYDLVLEPRFDGAAGDEALIDALLARRTPRVEICDVSGGPARALTAGLPAVERPDILASALDMVLARTIQLVERAVREAADEGPLPTAVGPGDRGRAASPPGFFVRTLVVKLVRWLEESFRAPDGWRVAVRHCEGSDIASSAAWSADRFALLPDFGKGFQADPFPFAHGGRTCLFYEEFPFSTRKGVIAMVELDVSGGMSPARCVLEHEAHLSYPFIFAHEDAIYMLPEMSGARRIQLFRADPFPDRWVPDRILVDDVVAADATLVEHDGRWWIFATLAGDCGSSWDALCLFHAPHPFGPWTPHAGNPVLIDAGAARPAGGMWRAADTLMRVAQDCRGGYGRSLAICRVDRLDTEGYAQTIVARLDAPAGLGADRVHTLNRACGLEAIDLAFAPRRRALQARR